MDSYTTGYKHKSWLNKSFDHQELSGPKLNKKGGKDRSFQWSYNNKNNFTTPNDKSNKKKRKKAKNKYKLKDIAKRNSELSDMYFKDRSQSSLPNGSSVDKRTIVDIVDSDMEICYRETNYNKKMNKRKKLSDNSSPVTPGHNHIKDSDLFYFDISGNRSTLPSPAKHIHFGDNNETLEKTITSPNSSVCNVVSIQSNMIQESKKARNIFNKPYHEQSLSPTLVMPKKRKKLSVTSDNGSTSQKEFNLKDAGNTFITEIKGSPKAKKRKHFMEYEPSNSAKSYSESFVGSKHEKSSNVIKSEKNNGTNKHDSASNPDDNKIYEFLQNMIMRDLGNNSKSSFKTTTDNDTPKLSTNDLIDVLSEVNPNNASAINNIDNSSNFNMKKLSDNSIIIKKKENNHSDLNSRTELSVKNKKKIKFSEESGDMKTVCASEWENSYGRSVINSIDPENSVTVRKKKKKSVDDVVLNKKNKSSNGSIIDNSSIVSGDNIDTNEEKTIKNSKKSPKYYGESGTPKIIEFSDTSRTELSVKNKKKNKFSEERGDMLTVCASELESSDGRSVINSIYSENNITVRKKRKKLVDDVVLNKKRKSSNGSIIDNSIVSGDNIDTNEEKTSKNSKKSLKDTPEITEFSDTSELIEKEEVIEETYNKLNVNAIEVCKRYDEFKSMYDRHSPASVDYKLNIEDVYTDDSNDESTSESSIVKIEWDNKLANLSQDLDEDEKQTLAGLEIVLPFQTIPPLHDIQRPSKPTAAEIKRAKQLNAKLGPFSKHEDEQIVTNWENFCKDHNLSVKPSVFFKFHRSVSKWVKIKFLQYLSHKLDNRHPLNVHSRFQRLFSNNDMKSGRFTKKEDEQIIKFINKSNSKTPYRDLGILLGRSAQSINRRISILSDTRHGDKIGWNLDLSKRLIEGMFTVTGLKRVEDLEHVTIDAEQWRKLSILLDNISEKKLQGAWLLNVHPRLFSKETNATIKRDLIKMMLVNKERDFRTVNWKKYADNFNGINERKLYELFVNMMRQKVPKEKWSNLRKVVKYLSTKTCRSRKIHRYIYKDGKLKMECK